MPPDFSALIHAKTEGSPLFMADLVRYLRDSGGIVEQNGSWVLARSMSDMPRELPESVRSMIARKIEQLDERDRALLLAASVQGHEFDSAIVSEAIEMDPADVEERLDVLERVHVFVKRGSEYEFPDLTLTLQYQFVHVLYQNMLYASLQPTRRAALSGRVARALVGARRTHARERGAPGGPVRSGARLCHERPLLLRGGAARGRPVRISRGAVAGRARAEGAARPCLMVPSASSRSSACR